MVNNRLANEHPVKRISMQHRKPSQIKRGFFVKREGIDAMLFALCGDKSHWRFRKQQLAKRIFNSDFPGRNRT
jgi:hypothetical protein